MDTIKDAVYNVMRQWDDKRKAPVQSDPWLLFKKLLTKKELTHIKFNYFRNNVLGVAVDSSAWLYKLDLQKEDLLGRLNKDLGMTIKDIRFRIGEIK